MINAASAGAFASYIRPASGDLIKSVVGALDISNSDRFYLYKQLVELTCTKANEEWKISGGFGIWGALISGVAYLTNPSGGTETVIGDEYTSDATIVSKAGIGHIIANKGTLLTLTLPESASYVGQIIKIVGVGAGGWKIAQNANDTIFFGDKSTTKGTGGYIASTHQRDCVELKWVFGDGSSDEHWQVVSSVGNITIV
jgi:hypothetical protein